MARGLAIVAPLTPAQLGRLQARWRAWTVRLTLPPDADQKLRHYFVQLFSGNRARQTRQLTREDAARVIRWLERLTRRATPQMNQAAGTAGRHGFPERRRVAPDAAAWRALWGVARALRMNRAQLDLFIAAHYSRFGLHSAADLRTMADLNRVLWGLKAILRRGPRHPGGTRATPQSQRKAA